MTLHHPSSLGTSIDSKKGYSYFLPENLQENTDISLPWAVIKKIEEAGSALGRLNAVLSTMPDLCQLFLFACIRVEATLSSRIEGTQTDIQDAFVKKEKDIPQEKKTDFAEVVACVRALESAINELENLPLCNRLIMNTHKILLSQVRGAKKEPGEFRRGQNWIRGSRPDNALFVPPAHQYVPELMGELEKFIHDETIAMPDLVKAALIHYQFETIHPFLDGNGRMGRMLIVLYLYSKKILLHPIVYISRFFESHRLDYYKKLDQARRSQDDLVEWISFFMDAVTVTATEVSELTEQLLQYRADLRDKLSNQLRKRTAKGHALLDLLFKVPLITAKEICATLGVTTPVANALLHKFVDLDILHEITGQRRNRVFLFHYYMKLLEGDAAYAA